MGGGKSTRFGMLRGCALLAAAAVAALMAGCASLQDAGVGEAQALELWRADAPAKRVLVAYVESVTREDSPDYIPPEERIAVFDFDGTLFCETAPTYFDWMLFDHRVLDDRSCAAGEELVSAARSARETGRWPGLSLEREAMMAKAWRGFTPETLAAYVRAFAAGPQPGFTGMKRGEAFYRPMVEVVRFLESRGFTVYVCSGTDRFVARPVVEDGLSIPPRHVIGSDTVLVAKGQDGADPLAFVYGVDGALEFEGVPVVKNLQMNKVSVIAREIGARPVLAFGNSMSDASMLNYTLQNSRRKAMAFMLLCDDTVREYGNLDRAEKMRAACSANGWIPVSMRDDWMTIYGAGVVRDSAGFTR